MVYETVGQAANFYSVGVEHLILTYSFQINIFFFSLLLLMIGFFGSLKKEILINLYFFLFVRFNLIVPNIDEKSKREHL